MKHRKFSARYEFCYDSSQELTIEYLVAGKSQGSEASLYFNNTNNAVASTYLCEII